MKELVTNSANVNAQSQVGSPSAERSLAKRVRVRVDTAFVRMHVEMISPQMTSTQVTPRSMKV